MSDVIRTSKQRCFQIPVGPGALDESNLCALLARHGIRYWVNDMAVETLHGITRPVYTVPPSETCDGSEQCIGDECLDATTQTGHKPACPVECNTQKASEQPWPWPMCKGCGNEPNACTCDTQRGEGEPRG